MMSIKAAPRTDSRLAARCAALASLGAAVVHFAVVPAHWQQWALSGVFFAILGLLQLIWARVVLVRTTLPILAAGIVLNVGAITLWALSRTAGAPFGPHAGQAEAVQGADLAALLLEIYVVMGAGWIWYRGLQGQPVSGLASAAVLLGAVGVVTLASTVGVVSSQRHGHHHGPAEAADTGHHATNAEHADDHRGDNDHDHEPAPVVPLNVGPAAPERAAPLDGGAGAPEPPQAPAIEHAPAAPAQPLHDHSSHEH
ncbi:hypothetical protein BST17_00220 [Mycolicibacterium bacteremicum]|uniref:Uncharacterized protein n=2 Tax=Mycobacteriaceae TaxID=1762 RepID=A0A1W9Z3N7_MYCBA|nr:hypothetical protein BST17_00220 [Mycolicibacterium bacteremicum]